MNDTSSSLNGALTTPQWVGMLVAVVRLRVDGRHLSSGEYRRAERLRGRLILRPTDKWQTGGGASHIAELAKPGQGEHGFLGAPLFNPMVEQIDYRGIVLSGYEARLVGGAVQHVEQVWLVNFATADGAGPAP